MKKSIYILTVIFLFALQSCKSDIEKAQEEMLEKIEETHEIISNSKSENSDSSNLDFTKIEPLQIPKQLDTH